jgi:FKBP-type peptidyl-prolyl cis-trans isomerase
MVTSTKTGMQRQNVEFVIGVGMIIKGFDRAIPKMCTGERSKIRCTPTYAYGARLLFSVTSICLWTL